MENIREFLIFLTLRLKDNRHQKGKDNGGGYACACGGQRARYRAEKTFFRPFHRTLC